MSIAAPLAPSSVSASPSTGGARAGISWQLILADLSLILFMITAGALSHETRRQARSATPRAMPVADAPMPGAPLALYRPASGAPSLAGWLAAQPADPRQQLTIVAQYPPGGQAAAFARARSQMAALGPAGARARIVVEPGGVPLAASLAYDAAPGLARGLHQAAPSAHP